MRKAKKSESKPVQNAEEAVTPVLLARLAAKIAPALCLNEPQQAIEAAAALIECAREQLEREQERASPASERAQLEAEAKHADAIGIKITGNLSGNLSLADAFHLQKEDRFSKGNRREGPYKRERDFVAALRKEKLTSTGLRKGTEQTAKNYAEGKGEVTFEKEAVEETTEQAVEALFKILGERRRAADNTRKSVVKRKK
jgi:hypothetical protein